MDHYDVVIAGGGMVGVSLALQLGESLPAAARILLVESFPLPPAGSADAYHPSFDARSTALSYSSQRLFSQMGVWDSLQRWLCPISEIHVSSRGHFGSVLLRAADYGWAALGHVVENAWLGNILLATLQERGRVELLSPARVGDVRQGEEGVTVVLEGDQARELRAALLVVADGAHSGLRTRLGFDTAQKSYGQHALIANVATAQPHDGRAFERFTDEGPLALLPLLPVAGAEHRSALVWTLPEERAVQLQDMAPGDFLAALQERFGYRLGRLRQVGERHTYPLALVRAAEQVRQGVIIMGNAAHALHPVAGQGFNLALRDIAVLGRVLAEGVAAGAGLGDLPLLRRYQQCQRVDQERTVVFSDQLPELFMRTDPVLGVARDLGLVGLDLAPALKRRFVRFAAGLTALEAASHG
jgi:2-octaprenyl-6-methoxyphenol hydroxylase